MVLDINQIRKILPHRYPFLLVDKVLELVPGERIVGQKNVTTNEPFFQGHFPHFPVMPGVLIIEALAQVSSILALYGQEDAHSGNYVVLFGGVDECRVRRKVAPGDVLQLHSRLDRYRSGTYRFITQATVDGQVCTDAVILGSRRKLGAGDEG